MTFRRRQCSFLSAPLSVFALCFCYACSPQTNVVSGAASLSEYNGRVGLDSAGVAAIYWPGSSVKTAFRGTALKAVMRDQRGHNSFNVIIDDDSVYSIRLDTLERSYTLASGLTDTVHTVELFRLTDWNDGIAWFYGFQYDPGAEVLPVRPKKRRIEFYGNSITVGAGMDEAGASPPGGNSTDNYLSYGAVTARHYDAAYTCIARSGIGLMVSWFSMTMPEMYDRLNPFDTASVWDFSKATPDIVVVNLMQNDYALSFMPDYDQFKKRFGSKPPAPEFIISSYQDFISRLRGHYPNASIVCVLGNMDATRAGSPWPGYIRQAVASLHDPKVYSHFFPFKNTPGHPTIAEHQEMAESLIRFMDANVKW
ncbi:MAG TPA: SGNH/GDSL hydrolase family protein [Chryseosolibacter sp.]